MKSLFIAAATFMVAALSFAQGTYQYTGSAPTTLGPNGFTLPSSGIPIPAFNVVYVATNGNDQTAALGKLEHPAATIQRANQIAFNAGAGAMVYVEPGLYVANNLLTNGVNYFFSMGARVYWQPLSTNNVSDYWAIFDDRACGPTTNVISGQGDFQWQGWTNYLTSASMTTGGSNQNASGMCGGVLTITNPASSITISANSMQGSSWVELGASVITAQSGNLYATINWMADPAGGANLSITNVTTHTLTTKSSSCIGITWNDGIQHIYCRSNACGLSGTRGNNYALWGNGFSPSDVGDFYYDGDFIGGKIYTSFQTTNSVTWIHVKRVQPINGGGGTTGNPLTMFGSQKTYVYADKMQSAPGAANSSATIDSNQQSGTSNVLAWLTIQKLVGSNLFFNCPLGAPGIYAEVQQYDDLSGGACTNGVPPAHLFVLSQQNGNSQLYQPLEIATNATPLINPPTPGFGRLIPSNYDLYWVTPLKTNLAVPGH